MTPSAFRSLRGALSCRTGPDIGLAPQGALRRRCLGALPGLGLAVALPAVRAAETDESTYDQDTILHSVESFFGQTTEGLAKVVERAFRDQGRPNAYIQGEEAGAALTVGLRYGDGTLIMKSGSRAPVHWAGPSIGFDVGANASKVFALVYHLKKAADIYDRFPGVDGSLYYVGGAGINYVRRDDVVVAPIRLGVGLRAGASVGYMHFRATKSWNPI
jgi:hypothetical protein